MHVSTECWKLQHRERLCVQLGHFARLCIAAATTGFVLIGWINHFRVRTWPISPYPAGADQGMEKQTGLVTHKHNQECRPAWIYYSWRMEEHGGGECWQNSHSTFTAEHVCKALFFLIPWLLQQWIYAYKSLQESLIRCQVKPPPLTLYIQYIYWLKCFHEL